jgi:hypothetical protein
MPTPSYKPDLVINYSPALDLRITFVYAQGYEEVSLPEYRFAVNRLLRHCQWLFYIFGQRFVFRHQIVCKILHGTSRSATGSKSAGIPEECGRKDGPSVGR